MSYLQDAPFRAFWAWWWPSITACFPEGIRNGLAPNPRIRFLRWTGDAVEPVVDRLGDGKDSVLLLPRRSALIRNLQLPGSAATRLRDIARFEIERQTPFQLEQVYFDAVPEAPPQRGQSTLSIKLVVVPTSALDPAVEAAATLSSQLVAVDVEDADGVPVGANLLPPNRRYRPPERWRRWNIALLAICAVAAFGLLTGLLHARQRGIATLERQAAPLLIQAENVQRREAALAVARQYSTSPRTLHPLTALELLSLLSRALPADSHFIHVEISEGIVIARGQTADLPRVLAALRDPTHWKDPELTGSRTLLDGRQEFSLRLHLRDQ